MWRVHRAGGRSWRPALRQRVMWWVWDGGPEWLTLRLPHRRIGRVLCWIWGHDAVADGCGLPEHDSCAWCFKIMPGQAHWDQGVRP